MGSSSPAPSLAIIVIESSPEDFELLLRKLRAADRHVDAIRVQNAAELRLALCSTRHDAVIAEHRLATITSTEALNLVRDIDPDMPFLIVTGAMGEELAVEAM